MNTLKVISKILLISTLAIMPCFAQENKEDYFYYRGEKQFLELNTGYLFISTIGLDSISKESLFRDSSFKYKKESLSSRISRKLNTKGDFYWSEASLGSNISKSEYDEKVLSFKSNPNFQVVSPYYKFKGEQKVGLSNFFYVKLKAISDTIKLLNYASLNKVVIVKQDEFMPLWFVLSCTKQTANNSLKMANQFFESGLFEYAEPDLMPENTLHVINDPYFPQQWGLQNTGQYGGTTGYDIKAINAWKLSTGNTIKVAVVDCGIQLTQPDLVTNIYSSSFDGENNSTPSVERGDHATSVAGILGAVSNSIGVTGVAPNCKLMSISNIMNESTPNLRQKIAAGINWAWNNGADIISNSWGSNALTGSYIDDAITNALNLGRSSKGCIVVFSAGNDNGAVVYPANSNSSILAVGAMSECGQRKSPTSCDTEWKWGSNYGTTLDVVCLNPL